ncbi:MAG: hypothetical protein IKF42_03745 [Mogibacterium sp.]|nr:hypothetical protein [Mogibacterium sp.]
MLYEIGITLITIGGSMLGSDCLIIPMLIAGIGAACLYIASGREAENGD